MKIRNIKTKKAGSAGFTLIELMITVAIVGILAAVALPAYQNYVIRGQVSEGFTLAGGVQTAETESYDQTGSWPADLTTLGLSTISGKYVSTVALGTSGAITINYSSASPQSANSKINGGSVTLTPKDDGNGNIHWACAPDGTTITTAYVPSSCTAG